MSTWLQQLDASQALAGSAIPIGEVLRLFGHAIGVGGVLSVLTWAAGRKFNGGNGDLVLSSASVVFLCLGMTAVMILVNDNLARAFAIGAAIALVRFRVKVAGKFLGVGLLYGVLTGMACGVGRTDVAWLVTGCFGLLLLGALAARRSGRPTSTDSTNRQTSGGKEAS